MKCFAILTLSTSLLLSTSAVLAGPLLKVGTSEASHYEDALAVECPRPEIPSALQEQCYKSCCIARFLIKPDGKSQVQLLSSSGSEEVDDIALSTLRRWKFKPALLDGAPVQSTRKIKVEFEIE
jgi:protein TonB